MNDERYSRQQMIEWWSQEKLKAATVFVAGAGALGNELLKNLALVGVGRLVIVDFDKIEPSNLSRTVLFTEEDVGKTKVEVAASRIRQINPEIEIIPLNGDLFYDIGLGRYRESNLVVGCLDNIGARARVNLSCILAGVPYLDGGMWSMGGEVRWFSAVDGPCYDCTLNEYDRIRSDERRSCSGYLNPEWTAEDSARVPTVATTSSIIGGIMSQEVLKYLCGYTVLFGKAIVYNGQSLSLHRSTLPQNPNCLIDHNPIQEIIPLPFMASKATFQSLLTFLADTLEAPINQLSIELGRDFLQAFSCPQCGNHEPINMLWARVSEQKLNCPACGGMRDTEVFRSITIQDPDAMSKTLATFKVPPKEMIAIRLDDRLLFGQLAG